jgi:hypothetical protein
VTTAAEVPAGEGPVAEGDKKEEAVKP